MRKLDGTDGARRWLSGVVSVAALVALLAMGACDAAGGGAADAAGGGADTGGGEGADTRGGGGDGAGDPLAACLAACADRCAAEPEVCSADGEWACACELDCREVAVAADPLSCCEPVAPACLPRCEDGVALTCTPTLDERGCPGLRWDEEDCGAGTCVADPAGGVARCEPADPETLCAATGGVWDEAGAACDCGQGGGFDAAQGCAGVDEALCESTGGTWHEADCGPFCGTCECPEGEAFVAGEGCGDDELAECLAACGDGCFLPQHMVCGEDGEFHCPCEMACRGIAPAPDVFGCCEPVPAVCVPVCDGSIARNCATDTDDYGCLVLVFDEVDCGAAPCVVDLDGGNAHCEPAGPEQLCAGSGGTWQEADAACDCGPGGAFDPALGCWGIEESLCEGTGGTWHEADCGPFCGTCECPEGAAFLAGEGCVPDDLAECLAACGDGCFLPQQMVCGEDGEFHCPCELACRGIAPAPDVFGCCEPVPPACVPVCDGAIARNCTTDTDDYGCLFLVFEEEDCAGGACVVDEAQDRAICAER